MPASQPSASAKWSVKAKALRCANGCGNHAPTKGSLCRPCWNKAQPPPEWVAEWWVRRGTVDYRINRKIESR